MAYMNQSIVLERDIVDQFREIYSDVYSSVRLAGGWGGGGNNIESDLINGSRLIWNVISRG